MGLTSLKSAFDDIKNPDISGWEKFTTVLMSLSIGISSTINGFNNGILPLLKAIGNGYTKITTSITEYLGIKKLEDSIEEKSLLTKFESMLLK